MTLPQSARISFINSLTCNLILFAVIIASLLFARPAFADLMLTFGLYTSEKPTTVVRMFTPLLNVLEAEMSRRMGEPVTINIKVAKTYKQGVDELVSGKVDFARFGAVSYVLAKQVQPGLRLLAAETDNGKKVLFGVIGVRADSPLRSVQDLKGKSFAFGDENSTIGRYLSQLYLLEQGIRAGNLGHFEYLQRHDAVASAVSRGRFDAGAFKEGTLNRKVEGEPPLRVLARFPAATRAYIAQARMNETVFKTLQAALLDIKNPMAFQYLAEDCADGFAVVEDADYDRIRAAMQRNAEFFR